MSSKLTDRIFSPQQLTHLQEDDILTCDEVNMIKWKGGRLNEENLKSILEQKLSLSQATKILKRPHLTEYELKLKFDKIWDELIKQLPTRTASSYSIQHEVEQALISFVQAQKGYHGHLTAKLREKSLDKWISNLKLKVVKTIHFEPKSTIIEYGLKVVRFFRGTTNEYEIEAQEVTASILNTANQHLDSIKSNNTTFNNALVDDLLRKVKETMENCFCHKDRKISFTMDYQLDIYITVCSYSVGVFEKMAQMFEERNDPKLFQ